VRWRHVGRGRCAGAHRPPWRRHVVYQTFLNRPAVQRRRGRTSTARSCAARRAHGQWSAGGASSGPSETSPLVSPGGSSTSATGGTTCTRSTRRTGATRWTFRDRRARVEEGGRALRQARLRRLVRRARVRAERAAPAATNLACVGAQPRLGSTGTFYATPAVGLRPRLHRLDRPQVYSTARRPARCAGRTAPAATSTRRPRCGSCGLHRLARRAASTASMRATGDVRCELRRATAWSSGAATVMDGHRLLRRRRGTGRSAPATRGRASWSGRSPTGSTRRSSRRRPGGSTSSGTGACTRW
jgi:hypothetical protein